MEYQAEFNKLMAKKIANPSNLKRYGLFRCVLECRVEVAKYTIFYSGPLTILE